MQTKLKWMVRGCYYFFVIYAYFILRKSPWQWFYVNTFLAYLSTEAAFHLKAKQNNLIYWPIFLVWLAFYPNAPYTLTDLFHLTSVYPFDASGLMVFNLHMWFYFSNLVAYAFICATMGIWSADYVAKTIIKKLHKAGYFWQTLVVSILLFLGAVGIYIGRFLRLNTTNLITSPKYSLKLILGMWNVKVIAFITLMFLLQLALWFSLTFYRHTNNAD